MNTHLVKKIMLMGALVWFTGHAFAIDVSNVPEDKRSAAGLYFTSVEASEYMENNAETTLFLDIRDPVEIFVMGMPIAVDHHITFKYIDPTQWNENNQTFGMKGNPDFKKTVREQLKAKGLTNADNIILICGSGMRSAMAATALKKAGYKKVYSVIDGYSGWQQADLKWSTALDKNKVLVEQCNRGM